MKNQTREPAPLTLADIVCRWYVGAMIGFAVGIAVSMPTACMGASVGATVSWIFQKCRKKS